MDADQIKDIAKQKGRAYLTYSSDRKIIGFSGDTPVDDYSKWDGFDILIHESTFLNNESDADIQPGRNKHSSIVEVLKMVDQIDVNTLILNHFSSRYSKEEILATVRKYLAEFNIDIPVYIIFPGEIHRDILSGNPIN